MSLRYRRRIRMGPLPIYLNLSRSSARGWSHSWSFKLGPWSWNSRSRRQAVDLPGGFSWREAGQNRRSSQRPPTAEPPEPRARYRPARWPYAVLAVLFVLAVIGGAMWQALLVFGVIALVVAAVQTYRARGRRPMPVSPPAPEPIDYEGEARAADAAGMHESARAWRQLAEQHRAQPS